MKSTIATLFLCVLFGPFGIFCAVWAGVYVGRAEFLSAVVALGSAVFALAMVAMLVIVASSNVSPRVTFDGAGVLVRPDCRVDGLLMASTVGGFIAMALYAICEPLGKLDIPAFGRNQTYFVIACALGVLVGVMSLRQMFIHRGSSYVRMDIEGIETGNTMTSAERPWNEVADIADRPPKGSRPTGATYIVSVDGRTRVLPTGWYTPEGQQLRDVLRFYWQHPDQRAELYDGRAVQRLRAESRGVN